MTQQVLSVKGFGSLWNNLTWTCCVDCDLWPLQRKREATDSDSEAKTPSTPSAEDVKKEKKKKKEKKAKLEEAGFDEAGAGPDNTTSELQTEVSEGIMILL